MKLTKENVQDWKKELDKIYFEKMGIEKLSEANSDETWLDLYEGDTPEYAVDTDLYYGSQN